MTFLCIFSVDCICLAFSSDQLLLSFGIAKHQLPKVLSAKQDKTKRCCYVSPCLSFTISFRKKIDAQFGEKPKIRNIYLKVAKKRLVKARCETIINCE